MGYLAYPEYKDSGVKWFRDIPFDWTVHRLKMLASEPLKYGANEAADLEDPNLPRFIRITDVNSDGSLNSDTFRSLPEKTAEPYLLEEGDILLARSGATVGKSFIYSPEWGTAAYAGYLIRLRTNQNILHKRFAYYFFQSSPYWANIDSELIQATIQNFSAEKYSVICIPTPDLDDQVTIGQFLDYKTAQIDRLIEKKQELIEKLQEQRKAFITHAITRGIENEVQMKESGIGWLGVVPAHWKNSKLKFESKIVDCKNRTPEYFSSGEYLVARTSNVRNGKLLTESALYTNQENYEEWTKRGIPPAGSILFTREAPAGEACLVPDEIKLCLGQRMMNFIINDQAMTEFILYFLMSNKFQQHIEAESSGSTVTHMRVEQVHNIPVCLPDGQEAEKIVSKIKSIERRCFFPIQHAEAVIERLQEYRTALITAAVTGQIDVRDWQSPEPTKERADKEVI